MKVLITGITGFVGGHLTDLLLAEGGHAVAGLSRRAAWPGELAHLDGKAELFPADLHDPAAVEDTVRRVRPDWLFHLAGYAKTGKSFDEPDECWRANLDGTRGLFDAVARSGVRPRILFASTGLVYGDPDPGREATDEATTLKPASPYAASKAAADLLAYQVTRTAGLDVVRVRLFNQIGPRQSAEFAVPNFARQIAAIERGEQPPELETGDLSAYRDLTDVRDMADALVRVLRRGVKGAVYNAGSGRVWKMADVLAQLVALARVPIRVKAKAASGRIGDTAVSRADPRKLHAATGWQPKYDLGRTLADVLESWRTSPHREPAS
jgi:GDP-4-dehydro-6-deoxy-D-mannose reductase